MENEHDSQPHYRSAFPGYYRPFRKKRFVKGSNGENVQVEEESKMDEAERAQLGVEVSSFYSQLTTSRPTKRPRSATKSDAPRPVPSSSALASEPAALPPYRGASAYFCSTCNDHVPSTVPVDQHKTSTIHLFHSTHKPTPTFGIPANNVGFQLLLHKFDWEQDKGLGPEGQGRMEPVPTRLRAPNDRKGVGHEATLGQPLRITHTKPRHGNNSEEEEEGLEQAPLLPNEAPVLDEEAKKKRKKMKKKMQREKRQQKRDCEARQRRHDQGLREAVYNEWPVLLAP